MQFMVNISIAFMVTLACIYVLRPLALRLKLVAIPGGRHSHFGHIPLVGGIGMFIGFALASMLLPISLNIYRALFAGSALIVFVGVLDDFNEISAKAKLLLQLAATCIMIYVGDVRIHDLGNLFFFGNIHLPIYLSWWVTIVATLGVMNAVNMTDGLDGLAASISLVELSLLLFLSNHIGAATQVTLLALLMSVVLAYLVFNFPVRGRVRAWAFMGDAGSLFLGFVLSWFLISLSQVPFKAANPVVFIWIMAVPLFDATAAIIRRLIKKKSPFSPDAKHLHHLFQRVGCHPTMTVFFISGISLAMGLLGISLDNQGVSEGVMFTLYIAIFFLYTWIVNSNWRTLTKALK